MALSADPSYIVIPVQDPFLYQWFMWQMWLPDHIAMALHSCVPCACCGSSGGAAVQPYSSEQSARHGSWTGAREKICLAKHLDLDQPNQISQSAGIKSDGDSRTFRKTSMKTGKGRKRFKSQRSSFCLGHLPDLDIGFEEELMAYAVHISCGQTEITELQVDWNSPGPGFVKNELCNYDRPGFHLNMFAAGGQIQLQGLRMTDVNGQSGTITTPLLPSGRHGVQLETGKQIAVRPCNMRRFYDGDDASVRPEITHQMPDFFGLKRKQHE